MNWRNAHETYPANNDKIIVALMHGRIERSNDPIFDVEIVILRNHADEWRTMDGCGLYYLPETKFHCDFEVIEYWMPWQEFGLPSSLIVGKK